MDLWTTSKGNFFYLDAFTIFECKVAIQCKWDLI